METFKGYSRTQEDKELIGILKESLCVLGWKPSLQEQSRGSSVVKGILLFLKGKLLRTTKELLSIQKTKESMSPEEQMGLLMKQNDSGSTERNHWFFIYFKCSLGHEGSS